MFIRRVFALFIQLPNKSSAQFLVKRSIPIVQQNRILSKVVNSKIGEQQTQISGYLTESPLISSHLNGDGTAANREAAWRTIKYTLLLSATAVLGTGIYLVVKFGKPQAAENGLLIPDEFYAQPTPLQYIRRALKVLEGYVRLISEPSREKLLPDELNPPYYQPLFTLVLELTDVLVHPDWTYQTGWRFKKRPGVEYLLETLSGLYEIVIYTAEQGMTVFPIVEALDPKNLIMYKLVRDATNFVDGAHVKDLNKLNRDLSRVIVVDWNANSAKFHPDNVFQIPRWDGNDNDTSLIDLTALLVTIAHSGVEDVREVINYYKDFDDGLAAFREKRNAILEDQDLRPNTPSESPIQKLSKNLFAKQHKLL
ncbi:mitochondrial import inner membrane translocase subunit TIM50-C-like [Photinus pyralis]|uniref:mitochondrial import inner membrane translocase subunit TIM50-C-like n=1 Tax=Photinus pyralis TaxID=7054 RepID=UPI00126775A4|nr:mitochondrial import inner membrane translocase subunit TIM50-C-like [Photinus pyralis]